MLGVQRSTITRGNTPVTCTTTTCHVTPWSLDTAGCTTNSTAAVGGFLILLFFSSFSSSFFRGSCDSSPLPSPCFSSFSPFSSMSSFSCSSSFPIASSSCSCSSSSSYSFSSSSFSSSSPCSSSPNKGRIHIPVVLYKSE